MYSRQHTSCTTTRSKMLGRQRTVFYFLSNLNYDFFNPTQRMPTVRLELLCTGFMYHSACRMHLRSLLSPAFSWIGQPQHCCCTAGRWFCVFRLPISNGPSSLYTLSTDDALTDCFSASRLSGSARQGDEYMINARDESLHLRTYPPADGQEIKALVIFVHGYVYGCMWV